jgi:hypothetical protein
MWGEHVIEFMISEVEFTKLNCCNLILVCSNYVYPLWEVHRNEGVFEISRYDVSIFCATQRSHIGG